VNVVVVYESLWGNTRAVAQAIAEGIGEGATALSTAEATAAAMSGAGLVVAGAPVLAFRLPTEDVRKSIANDPASKSADLTHPSMRSWLDALPAGQGRCASFETRLKGSPGGATKAIDEGLHRAGYRPVAKAQRFYVKGKYGPLRDGEL
jgi:hypothetical protein